jgi:4'-phosphopantetheinyl transferase EntD
MLAELLPPAVHAVEAFDDPPEARLLPEEETYVVRAVEARRREFTTGRHCALAALGRPGLAPTAFTRGRLGAPGWPAGVVGSITHCAGYRAAAVARVADLITIGIDAEPNEPLPDGGSPVVQCEGGRVQGVGSADRHLPRPLMARTSPLTRTPAPPSPVC